jgi:16S rRNA (cytosine967-C5)-methyltransferase
MRLGARIKAATEVLADIFERHRPASNALADWGKAHRFAGSGDRAAIGTLVYDVLRRRQSLAAQMQSATPRALVLAAAPHAFGLSVDEVTAAAEGPPHALEALSGEELAHLRSTSAADIAPSIAADIPDWLMPSFERAFGDRVIAEGQAMAERAPVDLRVNTTKATRDNVLKALESMAAEATCWSPVGIRVPAPAGAGKSPHVESEAAHGRGWFEVQDEGSQIAALLAGARPGMQVLDLCAGAGGKTLALSAAMENEGQIYAYDSDKRQLRPIFERLQRAEARNVQVLDGGDEKALLALGPRFDLVLVDAPCTGTGTWRRRPDSKWRLKPESLATRLGDQRRVLDVASRLVKPGGRLVYVTCSVLPEENGEQIESFLHRQSGFSLVPYNEAWLSSIGTAPPSSADGDHGTLLLTPASHGTDGFFIAVLKAAG